MAGSRRRGRARVRLCIVVYFCFFPSEQTRRACWERICRDVRVRLPRGAARTAVRVFFVALAPPIYIRPSRLQVGTNDTLLLQHFWKPTVVGRSRQSIDRSILALPILSLSLSTFLALSSCGTETLALEPWHTEEGTHRGEAGRRRGSGSGGDGIDAVRTRAAARAPLHARRCRCFLRNRCRRCRCCSTGGPAPGRQRRHAGRGRQPLLLLAFV